MRLKANRFVIALVLIGLLFAATKYVQVYLTDTAASDSVEDVKVYFEYLYGEGAVEVYGPIEDDDVIYYAIMTDGGPGIISFTRLKSGRLEETGGFYTSEEFSAVKDNGDYILIATFDNIAKVVFEDAGKTFTYKIDGAAPGLYKYENPAINSNYSYNAYDKNGNIVTEYGII